MKKLMIAFAAVAFAFGAQAATVKWTSGTFSGGFTSPDGQTMKGIAGYTMTVFVYSDSAGTTLIDTSSSTAANNGGAYTGTIGVELDSSKTYYAKAIITDGTNTREADLAAFAPSAQGVPTLSFINGANFATSGQKWGDWTSTGVPEPTSGLLMLLGVAGLALRRRRA